MLSVAREEAVLISAEVAATARTAISETATTGSAAGASAAGAARAEAVNPLAVRAAMEVAAKEVGSTAGISRSIAEVASRDAVAGGTLVFRQCGCKLMYRVHSSPAPGSRTKTDCRPVHRLHAARKLVA
jgi:hypothetical protein